MKLWKVFATVICLSFVASAHAALKPCQDLKTEIAKKLDAKGVTGYTLAIADKGKEAEGKIVGSCEGGTKSIVYQKTTPAQEPRAAKNK